MTVVFAKFSDDRSNEVKIQSDWMTWPQLSEEFFSFLQGCGYVLERADFAEYWSHYLNMKSGDTQ